MKYFAFTASSILLVATTLIVSCGKQSAIPQSEWEKMIAIRAEAAEHYRVKTEQDFQLAIGATSTDTAQLREMSQHLFTRRNIDLLQRIENSFEPGREETKARRLRHYLIDGLIDLTLEPERRYVAEIASRPIDLPDGSSITIQQIPQALATESNRDRREVLYNSQLPMLKRINAVKEVELQRLDSLLMSLQYGSVTSYYQEVRDYDFAQLAVTAERVLRETDSTTADALHRYSPDLIGISGLALRAYDIPALWYAQTISDVLTTETIAATIDSFHRACAAVSDTLPGLSTYWPDGNTVALRSATYPVSALDDTRVVTVPRDGFLALSNYWHEIGHALHYLNTEQRDFEYIYLGASAERETMAFLLEQILDLPNNFAIELGLQQQGAGYYASWKARYTETRALYELLSARSECLDFLYEYQFFAGLSDPVAAFSEFRQRLYKHPVEDAEQELYLSRLSMFESADYLVARITARNIAKYLVADQPVHDPAGKQIAYFQTERFSQFLRDCWSQGSALNLEFISDQIPNYADSPQALIDRLNALGSHYMIEPET